MVFWPYPYQFLFSYPMLKGVELPCLLHLSAYVEKYYNQFYVFLQLCLSIQLP